MDDDSRVAHVEMTFTVLAYTHDWKKVPAYLLAEQFHEYIKNFPTFIRANGMITGVKTLKNYIEEGKEQ